jgi:hypothetical protein
VFNIVCSFTAEGAFQFRAANATAGVPRHGVFRFGYGKVTPPLRKEEFGIPA